MGLQNALGTSQTSCLQSAEAHIMLVSFFDQAPEILLGKPYNEKVDCWSLGVMLYRLLSGEYPFNSMGGEQELFKVIEKGKFTFSENWDNVSEEAKDLVLHLLHLDPDQRLSMSEIKDHPWMNKF